ncbi:MAG: hypothetical protein RL518_1596 [Pseudomonadota bacterium]
MKLSQPLLKTISYQLCHGNPWWGLVVINEYLAPTTPLHTALCNVFKRRVASQSELAQRLCSGALYDDLSLEEQRQIGSRAASPSRGAPIRPRAIDLTQRNRDRRRPARRQESITPATIKGGRPSPLSMRITLKTSTCAPALRVVRGASRKFS